MPRVIKLRGNEINSTIGLINKFTILKTITTIKALINPVMVIPGINQAINIINKAKRIHLIITFIIFLLYEE